MVGMIFDSLGHSESTQSSQEYTLVQVRSVLKYLYERVILMTRDTWLWSQSVI